MKIDKHAYGEDYNKELKDKLVKIASVAVPVIMIFVIGILAWALPQPTYSEYEKRDLNQMPEFSVESLLKGEYTLGVELAYADTFTFREGFVKLQAAIEEARGIRVEGAAIYGPVPVTGDDEDEEISSSASSSSQPESLPAVEPSSGSESAPESSASSESDSISQEESSEPEVPEDEEATGETVAGIFVYKGIGFELFGGSKKAAEYYASVINKYEDAFGDSVNIYNMVVPKHAEFYPFPRKYANLSNSEKNSIDNIYSMLDSGITAVDAYSVLEEHSEEYIYFNTDHHWTGLGAYYAYTAFMDAAGLSYYDYESYTKHTIEPFRGTLYAGTNDQSMYDNPDSVEWCEFPVANKTWQYNKGDLANYFASSVMAGYAKGANAYGVFLGGDFPLTVIKTNVNNGRKLVIIKESYGNAPATYIASGFEETYVVDERYYAGNLAELVSSRGITDILIINNVAAANTNFHIANIESLLTQTYSGAVAYPEETVNG
ncbi:MAG: hypothetical protein IJA06_06685 [Oscillospiraceae bacterium]|nr:hypothetical protein [Oscillospiraceae bacterium]